MSKHKTSIETYSRLSSNLGGKIRKVSSNRKKVNIVFIIIAILVSYWIYHLWEMRKNPGKQAASGAPVSVSVADVRLEDVPNIVSLVGTVYAYETVALKSRIDSQINAVRFKDGDNVKEGQILFILDDSLLKAQVNQYEANLKRDQAQLENARTQYERYRKLSAKGFASSEKMEEASAAFKTQSAAVTATKASIESLMTQLKFTTITAPITGRAGTINVTRGNTIKANDTQPLVTINRVQPIFVQFAIPQRYYDSLRESGTGKFSVTAQRGSDGKELSVGNLEYIDNIVDSATGSFNARAVFKNADEKLWPGMFVNIAITINVYKNAVTIPQVAVQNGQDGAFVFIVDDTTKKATKKPVEVLHIQDDKAVIKNGLVAGEHVVTDGLLKLSDGAQVEILSPVENRSKNPAEEK